MTHLLDLLTQAVSLLPDYVLIHQALDVQAHGSGQDIIKVVRRQLVSILLKANRSTQDFSQTRILPNSSVLFQGMDHHLSTEGEGPCGMLRRNPFRT